MVPVSGPVDQINLLAGDSGSTLGSISSTRYFVARPREPMYDSAQAMLRGSGVTVPLVRLTRRIFPAQDMMCSPSGARLIAEPVGPLLHAVQAGPVGVDVGDGTGWASIGAGRLAAAQVALLHLAGFLHVIHRAKRAGDGTDLAPHAGGVVDDLRAGEPVDRDRLHRTGVQAPGLVALGARVRHFLAGVMEVEDLDARLGRRESSVVFERAGHLALQAACAFVRVDMQNFLHVRLSWRNWRRAAWL